MSQDIKPMWLNLARRCQSVFGGPRAQQLHKGFAVMQITVLVGPDGSPVFWTEPEVKRFEPCRTAQLFLHQVLEKMNE